MQNNQQTLPIFIVNLKKDVEKILHMQELYRSYSLQPQFIEAIDGKLLSEDTVDKLYSENIAVKTIRKDLTRGEIVCALSHKSIYEKIINNDIGHAIIMANDIGFDHNFIGCIATTDDFPEDCDLLLAIVILLKQICFSDVQFIIRQLL